jgi:uncharacterized membrane protein YfcA
MHELDRTAAAQEATLNAARQQRADYFLTWLGRLPIRQSVARLAAVGFPFWLVLACVNLFWFAMHQHDNFHGAAIMAAIALASILSSIAGFAFSAICGAILFHFHDDPVQIVQIMIICSIANQVAMTWAARRDIDWRGLSIYFAGGAPGLAVGVWVLLNADRMLYTHAFGGFLLAYGAYKLVCKTVVIRRPPIATDFLAGFLGGITGGAAGFPGAFVTIWCGMKGWDKVRQRAVVQPFILVMQIAALLAISLVHRHGANGLGMAFTDILFIPAALFGTSVGMILYRRLTDHQFGHAVNVLLIVSGLSYIV